MRRKFCSLKDFHKILLKPPVTQEAFLINYSLTGGIGGAGGGGGGGGGGGTGLPFSNFDITCSGALGGSGGKGGNGGSSLISLAASVGVTGTFSVTFVFCAISCVEIIHTVSSVIIFFIL